MSLLWVQAAWYNAKPWMQEWDEHGHGGEGRDEREQRYIRQIADAHGVDHDTAHRALKHVVNALTGETPWQRPEEVGFASAPHSGHHELPEEIFSDHSWVRAPVHDVPVHELHASQTYISPLNVAHNLFHPGHRPPGNDEEFGHPDVRPPKRWSRADEQDEYAETGGPTDLPRMIRQTDGSHVVTDGHHRVATDMLLGKSHTRARVLDIRDLGGKRV